MASEAETELVFQGRLHNKDGEKVDLQIGVIGNVQDMGTNAIAIRVREALCQKYEDDASDWSFEGVGSGQRKKAYFNEVIATMVNGSRVANNLTFYNIHKRPSSIEVTKIGGDIVGTSTQTLDICKFAEYLKAMNLNNDDKLELESFDAHLKHWALCNCLCGNLKDCAGWIEDIASKVGKSERFTFSMVSDVTMVGINELGYWFEDNTMREYVDTVQRGSEAIESRLMSQQTFNMVATLVDRNKMDKNTVAEALKRSLRKQLRRVQTPVAESVIIEKIMECSSCEIDYAVSTHLKQLQSLADNADKTTISNSLTQAQKHAKERKKEKEKEERIQETRNEVLIDDSKYEENDGKELSNESFYLSQADAEVAKLSQLAGFNFGSKKNDKDATLYEKIKQGCNILGEQFGVFPINKSNCNIDCINNMNVETFVKYGWDKTNAKIILKALGSSIGWDDIENVYRGYHLDVSKCGEKEISDIIGCFSSVSTQAASTIISDMKRCHFTGEKGLDFEEGLISVTPVMGKDERQELASILMDVDHDREHLVSSLLNGDMRLSFVDKLELKIYHHLFGLLLHVEDESGVGVIDGEKMKSLVKMVRQFQVLDVMNDCVNKCGSMSFSSAAQLKAMLDENESQFENMSKNDQKFWLEMGLLHYRNRDLDKRESFLNGTLTKFTKIMLADLGDNNVGSEMIIEVFDKAVNGMIGKDKEYCVDLMTMLYNSMTTTIGQDCSRLGFFVDKFLSLQSTNIELFDIILTFVHSVLNLFASQKLEMPEQYKFFIAMTWINKIALLQSANKDCSKIFSNKFYNNINKLSWIQSVAEEC